MKRVFALISAILIALLIVVKPIKASAVGAELVAGSITAGSVWGAVAGGLGIGLAVGADAIAKGLDNGTIDNRVEQWLWNKASEWEYGYNDAKVKGEIYRAELTYKDLKELAAILSESYPAGTFLVSHGITCTYDELSQFNIPLDQPIYITDITQNTDSAFSLRLVIYTDNYRSNKYVDGDACLYLYEEQVFLLTGATKKVTSRTVYGCPTYYGVFESAHLCWVNGDTTVNYVLHDERESFYDGPRTASYPDINSLIREQFKDKALITTVAPTYVPSVGVQADGETVDIQDIIESLESVPFGMSEDDVAVSIPVTGEGEDVTDLPGVIPDNDDIIDNAPAAVIEGDFSGFTIPSGLMYIFPFSLPYDFYRGIKLFSAAPEVPEFTFNFTIPYPAGMGNGNLVDQEITLNFKQFEKLAIISRWISTFGFTMLLIKLSAFILKGGNS